MPNDRLTDDEWLRAVVATPAPHFGVCLWCRNQRCSCGVGKAAPPTQGRLAAGALAAREAFRQYMADVEVVRPAILNDPVCEKEN